MNVPAKIAAGTLGMRDTRDILYRMLVGCWDAYYDLARAPREARCVFGNIIAQVARVHALSIVRLPSHTV